MLAVILTVRRTYFKSEEPIAKLEAEFDWVAMNHPCRIRLRAVIQVVARKNLRLAVLGTVSIILAVIQVRRWL